MDDKLTIPSSSLPTLQEMQGKYLIAAIERKNRIAKQDDEEFESIVKLMDKVASLGYYSYNECKNDTLRFVSQEEWIKPLSFCTIKKLEGMTGSCVGYIKPPVIDENGRKQYPITDIRIAAQFFETIYDSTFWKE